MSPERWQKIEAVLDAVLEAEPPERPALLDRLCGGDAALRQDVESLLAADEDAGTFLERGARSFAAPLLERDASRSAAPPAAPKPTPSPSPPAESARVDTRPRHRGAAPDRTPRPARAPLHSSLLAAALLLIAAAAGGVSAHLLRPPPPEPYALHLLSTVSAVRHDDGASLTAGQILERAAAVRSTDGAAGTLPPPLQEVAASIALQLGVPEEAGAWLGAEPDGEGNDLSEAARENRRALLLYLEGRYPAAERSARRALELRSRLLPPSHPDLASSHNTLGVVLWALGRSEAHHHLEAALQIRLGRFGPDHEATASAANNLAVLLHERGELREAERRYEAALAAYAATVGPFHPRAVATLGNLAALRLAQGRAEDADSLQQVVVERTASLYGREHAATAAALHNLAAVRQLQQRPGEAEAMYRTALDIYDRALPEDHPKRLRLVAAYGSLLIAAHRLNEAARLLTTAHEALPDPDDGRAEPLLAAIERLDAARGRVPSGSGGRGL